MGRKIRPWKSIGKQPQDGLSVAMMEYIIKQVMYIKNSVKRSQYGILEIRKISVHIIHQSNFEARTNNAPKMVVHNDMDVSILSSRIAVVKIPNQDFFLSISSISVYFSKKHTCTSATVSIPRRPKIRTTKKLTDNNGTTIQDEVQKDNHRGSLYQFWTNFLFNNWTPGNDGSICTNTLDGPNLDQKSR